MTKKIIADFLRTYTGSDLPGDLHAYLLLLEGIKNDRQQLNQERRQIEASHTKIKESWLVKLRTLETQCPHPDTDFCDDPSGGNDSYYVCTYCGKETR